MLEGYYREGENVEESYQKMLKKYHRAKGEWEEKMIGKSAAMFNPGVTQAQRNKAASKLS